jgi:dTDP-4-dehydrorhamnose reductase
MTRILLTGAEGMLGKKVMEIVRDVEFIPISRKDCDLSDPLSIDKLLKSLPSIDGIWHIGAYTDVDRAEIERDLCFRINWISTKILSDFCIDKKLRMLYISTDYVFDGKKKEPYKEWDSPNPLNIYGKSKLFGEREVLRNPEGIVVRTSWLFGEYRENFVKRIIDKGKKEGILRVVKDQKGSPTYTKDLSQALYFLWKKGEKGLFHFCNKGIFSRYEFVKRIIEIKKIQTELRAIFSKDYGQGANRPCFSALDTFLIEKKLGYKIRKVEEALREYLKKL